VLVLGALLGGLGLQGVGLGQQLADLGQGLLVLDAGPFEIP